MLEPITVPEANRPAEAAADAAQRDAEGRRAGECRLQAA